MCLHGGRGDTNRVALVAERHLVMTVLLPPGAVLVLGGARRPALAVAVACERHACERHHGDGGEECQDNGGEWLTCCRHRARPFGRGQGRSVSKRNPGTA